METIAQHQEQLQYAEVYISDMLALKNLFLQEQNVSKENSDFGIPFLLTKKKNKILSFASLVISEKGEIAFKIYAQKEITESEKRNFYAKAENYFKRNTTPNFRNPKQLESSIKSMMSWLDF
ncbi:hypothetical protein C1637_01695 [Chryseobacterium lactis]|uniref:Uncharacterized protein n=1 Tax=Chryseobacterium lactis TaxID=1241981 RepID=A0A3G6RN49_CHRLC|nr:hypothetical protein [Chryseobacterium lactis]AZA81315.1 hypothetical protein EG342_05080 [Chryseobacterium lactis]AZB06315.1 hypothetical protein EG341_21205 [Chryseobacterium lactis]PNW15167.1 hypothetical protein C1637_01695 [Chryseobacterium lactis]